MTLEPGCDIVRVCVYVCVCACACLGIGPAGEVGGGYSCCPGSGRGMLLCCVQGVLTWAGWAECGGVCVVGWMGGQVCGGVWAMMMMMLRQPGPMRWRWRMDVQGGYTGLCVDLDW
ncbi:hypothetical protein DFH27DRAFT_533829 [Peziza echinospora]|nr:hypothetical protein DFH27DRAFT_533829 [Peziza echinospora]